MTQNPGPWGSTHKPRKASRLGLWLWLAALAGLGAAVWTLTAYFPGAVSAPMDRAYLVRSVAFIAIVLSGLLFVRDWNLKRVAKNITAWVGVVGLLTLAYSYQNELSNLFVRLRSGLIPGYPVETGPREAILSQGEGGNYVIYGMVNGTRVLFMIDTGASDIVLSPSDAKRAGIRLEDLAFDHSYETANGVGYGAKYEIHNLSIGAISLSDVPVSINQADMSTSLLGMSFLNRLKSYEFNQGKLILRW